MQVLMVAWMDDIALARTLETRKATYYSRSRGEHWVKGETSGHTQYVHSVRLDCDGDTVLLEVDQVGAACHTGDHTCFDADLLLGPEGNDYVIVMRKPVAVAATGVAALAIRRYCALRKSIPPSLRGVAYPADGRPSPIPFNRLTLPIVRSRWAPKSDPGPGVTLSEHGITEMSMSWC